MSHDSISLFIKGSRLSLIALLILILAGGIVRSSGSGMGCPDWPKCFNRLIPPTEANELPQNFKEEYLAKRIRKNNRLANMVRSLGFKDLGDKIEKDPNVYVVEGFNAFNTWAEYINRLIGMITGLCFLGVFFISLLLFKKAPGLFWISGLNLVLIFLQAYIGSWVVSTHLLSGLITVHMFLAVLILWLLITGLKWAIRIQKGQINPMNKTFHPILRWILGFSILLAFIQILLGSQVRESFDALGVLSFKDNQFMEFAGKFFPIHREVSLLVLLFSLISSIYVYRNRLKFIIPLQQQIYFSLCLVLLQMALGISLEFWHLPPFSQAFHVFFAIALFASQVWSWFLYMDSEVKINPVVNLMNE